jgi:hypothetical protein
MGDPRPERWAQQVEVGYLTFSVLPGVARATGSIRPYARLGGVLGIPITEHAEFVREGLDYRYSHSFEEDQVETELDPAIRLEAGSEFQASSILCRIGVGYTHGYGTVDIRHRQTDGPSIRFSGARNRAVDLVIGLDLNP